MPLSDVVLAKGSLALEGKVNVTNAAVASRKLGEQIAQLAAVADHPDVLILDCAALHEPDSSVVALLLSARRQAESFNLRVSIAHPTRQLLSLIELYEVTWLLD